MLRTLFVTLCLLAATATPAAAERAVRAAEEDIRRYTAEFQKAGPERRAYLRHLQKLLGLTRKRLEAAPSRGSPGWEQAMSRLAKLEAAMAAKLVGKAPPSGTGAGDGKVLPFVQKEVLVARADIHLGADASSKLMGEVRRGDRPLIIGPPQRGWHKIARGAVVEGWVHESAFRAPVAPPPAKVQEAKTDAAASAPAPETKPLIDLAFGAFHALVIGNNDYLHLPKLKTAVADAREVRRVLEKDYGFTVTLLENATRGDILRAVNRLRADLGSEDNLLIYYAGHGTLDRESDTGYWLPIDAEPDNDTEWIANAALTRHLKAMQANHVLVVADSCYSGTLFRDAGTDLGRKDSRETWLSRMNEKRSRTAIASGGLEPVMDSGGGRHSVFAKAFLAALAENDAVLDDQELYRRISRPVVLEADQTPRFADIRKSGHEGGAFLFVPKR